MRDQVADERIRQRLAVIPGIFFRFWFRLACGKFVGLAVLLVAVDDLAIAV